VGDPDRFFDERASRDVDDDAHVEKRVVECRELVRLRLHDAGKVFFDTRSEHRIS